MLEKILEPVQNKCFLYILKFITVKFLQLTHHDPLIKLTINEEMKLFIVSAREIIIQIEISCLLLSSNLAKVPVLSRSNEARINKTKIRIGIRLRSCTLYPSGNKIA